MALGSEVASEYAQKSLTYDHQSIDKFFQSVQENASPALVKRYDEVKPTLTQIMQQAQVSASGRVLGTSVTRVDAENYTVLVFANQRTQNVQNPQASDLPTLLKVAVTKSGDTWVVEDYGPAE
ncbi:MAG: hypothetical protein WBB62_15730 [Rhodococcus sp. (in: high G+C Gram-positive bacteria)]